MCKRSGGARFPVFFVFRSPERQCRNSISIPLPSPRRKPVRIRVKCLPSTAVLDAAVAWRLRLNSKTINKHGGLTNTVRTSARPPRVFFFFLVEEERRNNENPKSSVQYAETSSCRFTIISMNYDHSTRAKMF